MRTAADLLSRPPLYYAPLRTPKPTPVFDRRRKLRERMFALRAQSTGMAPEPFVKVLEKNILRPSQDFYADRNDFVKSNKKPSATQPVPEEKRQSAPGKGGKGAKSGFGSMLSAMQGLGAALMARPGGSPSADNDDDDGGIYDCNYYVRPQFMACGEPPAKNGASPK